MWNTFRQTVFNWSCPSGYPTLFTASGWSPKCQWICAAEKKRSSHPTVAGNLCHSWDAHVLVISRKSLIFSHGSKKKPWALTGRLTPFVGLISWLAKVGWLVGWCGFLCFQQFLFWKIRFGFFPALLPSSGLSWFHAIAHKLRGNSMLQEFSTEPPD